MNIKHTYESEIEKPFENDEWRSVSDLEKKKREHKRYAVHSSENLKRISIHLSEKDLINLKAKSLEEGIPYQAMVSGIIHKFLTGKLKTTA